MERERFEELVRRALDGLPEAFAERMDNVDVQVQDWPTPQQLLEARVPPGRTLLGLYQGTPLTRRSHWYNMASPDRIIIFQGPLERITPDESQLIDRVRGTVVHEIAHHFGISDERLNEIEKERRG